MGLANSVQRNILDDPNMPPLKALEKVQIIQKKLMTLLANMEKSTTDILHRFQAGDPAKMAQYVNKMQTTLDKFFQQMRKEISDEDVPPPPPLPLGHPPRVFAALPPRTASGTRKIRPRIASPKKSTLERRLGYRPPASAIPPKPTKAEGEERKPRWKGGSHHTKKNRRQATNKSTRGRHRRR